MTDPTQRFSDRVENYIKYRPGYPNEVIAILRDECRLVPDSIVADVGSGTGILTEMFLRNGNVVYGIEPNQEMRDAAERLLKGYQRFYSIAAKAEETTLSDASVDFIVAGQAFHWFDREKTKIEFNRILKPGGWTDYEQVDHRRIDAAVIREFFGSDNFRLKQFKNVQVFDYEGVKGRLLSSSYAPEEGHPKYEPMMAELQRIFQAHQAEGKVIFEYVTQMYYGQLS
jgi:ubiquinone/menaquinone biosynthesis C-methylase UbiE